MKNDVNKAPVLADLANRITGLREACGYTQQQLAQDLGVSLETYMTYEKDGSDIPISIIYEIANKFGVDFGEILTGTAAKLDTYHIVRKGGGRDINRFPGYSYQDLAYRYARKIMQPLLVTLAPSNEPAALVAHAGQEFNLVLEGSISVVFEDKEFVLNAGDSIYFNPLIKHAQRCVGDITAKFLTVISE